MSGIIWLASYPKSGNTWIRAFLANYLANQPAPVRINDLRKFSLGDNKIGDYEEFAGREMATIDHDEIARLRPQVHEWLAKIASHDVFMKTHSAVVMVNDVPLITPSVTAGAIYVVRNPLDVAVSYAHHFKLSYDQAIAAMCHDEHWLPMNSGLLPQYLGSWWRHVVSWLQSPGLTRLVLRYEDLSMKPLESFAEVTRFLGLPDDQARLKRSIEFSSFNELAKQEQSGSFIEAGADPEAAFFRQGQVGAWREALSQAQVAMLVDKQGAVMKKMGYLSGDGQITL